MFEIENFRPIASSADHLLLPIGDNTNVNFAWTGDGLSLDAGVEALGHHPALNHLKIANAQLSQIPMSNVTKHNE